MRRWNASRIAIMMTVMALGLTAAGASEEMFITVGGKASADGEVTFVFKPEQGEEQEVTVTILEGTNNKNAAREIRKEFVLVLSENYDVDLRGKDKKHVRIASKTPSGVFALELGGNTVGGLAISIK